MRNKYGKKSMKIRRNRIQDPHS
ncbi:MAG: hypothetical protein QG610_1413, partial [Euryarchaeota archaeon]|nr:hypothetical protein [Euryarchaeota archaeon]